MYWIKSLAWFLLTYSGLYLRVGAPGDCNKLIKCQKMSLWTLIDRSEERIPRKWALESARLPEVSSQFATPIGFQSPQSCI
jgi:hypothetical protein